jgi:excinuclease ABC subunit A
MRASLFKAVPAIRDKLQMLQEAGLGYIHIGQPATTLSGGEAQRVKLSRELSRRATGRTSLHSDEPTTACISTMCASCSRRRTAGGYRNTAGHRAQSRVIKTADWIIDLGPEGATRVGASWRRAPRRVAEVAASYTGQYRPLAQPYPSVTEPGVSRPLIIDTDPGIDDAWRSCWPAPPRSWSCGR